ncbi:MAG: Polysaccharide biosynthesis protein [Microgenomates group bacterium ADurb.Bin219]|nr:MAG: Polysaccharide biosynthesis protein [Microgenomates group bacterium ADurb.Bin219]
MKVEMKRYFSKLLQSDLLKGNLIMFVGSMVANIGSYFYHFLTGRILGPDDYGILSSLISLTYFLVLPTTVVNVLIVKYTSALKEGKGFEAAIGFYYWLNQKIKNFGVLGLLFLLLVSPLITNFFHYSSVLLVVLVGIFSLISLFASINTSTLQGFSAFGAFSLVVVFQSLGKLIIGVIFLFLGFGVTGAVFSLPISMAATYFLSFLLIQKLVKKQRVEIPRKQPEVKVILKNCWPILVSTLALTSFYTTDILLVRHFLPAYEAGLYASLANLGKIIFFASNSVGLVMLPTVSGRQAKGEDSFRPLLLSFIGVLGISLSLSVLFFVFPKQVIIALYGRQYLTVAPLMGIFSVFMILYSLVSLMINFYLAISQIVMIKLGAIAAILQVFLIVFFHQNILQIVWVNIGVLTFLLTGLLFPFANSISSGDLRGKV